MLTVWSKIRRNLAKLYTPEEAAWLVGELEQLVDQYRGNSAEEQTESKHQSLGTLEYQDAALVLYANSIESNDSVKPSLQVLRDILLRYDITQRLTVLHLLPFYPWDTDRGFSVKDYYQVAPEYGSWDDIQALSKILKLMFDFVANHASIQNPLVQGALIERHIPQSDPRYQDVKELKDFVVAYSDETKPSEQSLESLARPRPYPVLTRYTVLEDTQHHLWAMLGDVEHTKLEPSNQILGKGWVWTTFSRVENSDGTEATRQVDLNFRNPRVLLETIKILMFYVEQGAGLIRLDAVGYLWKKLDSTSLHERETHLLLEVVHDVMGIAAPQVITVAEVNEPQDKVFEYLGSSGHEESDLVYQFTHYPLAIHAVLTGNATYYLQWLSTLKQAHGRLFTMVLGSHDGMGMKPVRGILPEAEIEALLQKLVDDHGALPNYATLPGGRKIVYEACATPWNLINGSRIEESLERKLTRYLVVVVLGLIPRGLPAFYINGILGASDYLPESGLDENRTINREVFKESWLTMQLDDSGSQMHRVSSAVLKLLDIRASQPAFHPAAPAVEPVNLETSSVVSAILPACEPKDTLLSLINLSSEEKQVNIDLQSTPLPRGQLSDLISGNRLQTHPASTFTFNLSPYQCCWIRSDPD